MTEGSGPVPVEAAYERALEAEAVSVALIGRMNQRATETAAHDAAAAPAALRRFSRDAEHFPTKRPKPFGDSDEIAGGAAARA